ncbi:MAG TPA: ABC transporter permease, partial [Anaerolineales bacterium]
MNITQAILEALESLNANRLRAGLTMLGIIIGVGAVIAMLSVGQGAQATITSAISGIGTNLLFVSSGNMTNDVRNPKPLTLADAQAMA